MKTIRYDFSVNGREDSTEFCAETIEEADALFNTFLAEENLETKDIEEVTAYEVYNEEDKEEYRSQYQYSGNIFYKKEGIYI